MKKPQYPKKGRPLEVHRGSVTVRIYAGNNQANGRTYKQFTLVHHDGTQRKRRNFSNLASAKREAELVATKLARSEGDVLRLTAADRAIYLQALDHLRPFSMPLNVAVLDYVSALKGLPAGASLKEAVDFFRRRNPAKLEARQVPQVVEELLAAKRSARLSDVHIRDLESRLGRFAKSFHMNIAGVSGALLQKWLDQLDVGGRSKKNFLQAVGALFRFAIKRKYLPKEAIEEVESVEQAKVESVPIGIFTPEEMQELLTAARPEMVPWLAIAGFAGLRSAELQRLDWSEVNLAEGHIEIKASKAKTAARRLAPLTENLALWLAPHARKEGKVTRFESWWNQVPKLVQRINELRTQRKVAAPFTWKHNGLRHSFCSYRLASIKNAAQVALEAGNSPTMIFQHYRELVTPAQAGRWFGIQPESASKVVPLPVSKAA